MKKVFVFLALILCTTQVFAQTVVTGKVIDSNGEVIPGANVRVKGIVGVGTITDLDGVYSLEVPADAKSLIFSFTGMQTQEVEISGNVINITMQDEDQLLGDVVVTALGIKREEKSLGYAVTKLDGKSVNEVKVTNVANNLSGQVPGVNIISSSNLGGSANVVIRGGSSLTRNNQALFVVDGVPVINTSVNGGETTRGAGGYDYGNFASDINPEDIESVSVLKGASATALYGSRGANGVILITTKKGKKTDKIGVSVSSSVTFDKINTNTLPDYQQEYGGGSWGYTFEDNQVNIDGVDYNIIEYDVDESWGPKFDPTLMVRHWDSWDPNDAANYGQTRPWVAAENGVESFFRTGVLLVNTVALEGGNENGSFRLSYTNQNQDGTMVNSNLTRNNIGFNGTLNLSKKLTTSISAQYSITEAIGRPGTGYDASGALSFMASAGMWMQTNVDYKRLENYISETGEHKTWNRAGYDDPYPTYWDNPYWTKYKNTTEDVRNRLVGSWNINYEITDWLAVMGRISTDQYDLQIESQTAKQSHGTSYFQKKMYIESERNYDLMLNLNKKFGDDISLTGTIGAGRRDNKYDYMRYSTEGGLIIDDLYTINNSVSGEISKSEGYERRRTNSIYGTFSLGYKNFAYLDIAGRNDWSSTLPVDNASFFYPSVSTTLIFSELVDLDFLSFGKLRANWAQVGSDAPYSVIDNAYANYANYNEVAKYGNRSWLANPNLESELSTSWEIGTELKFLNNRVGIDFSYYQKKSDNQIIAGSVSVGSGYFSQYMNSGSYETKGYELALSIQPIRTNDFTWDMRFNFSQYKSKVLELAPGISSITLNSWNVAVAVRVDQPMGVLVGTDYVYNENGEKLVNSDGTYQKTENTEILGDVNPDYRAGLTNTFTYKGFRLSALIDAKIGGEFYSNTRRWGNYTGILQETVGNNELGNPKRDPITYVNDDPSQGYASNTGGVLLEGVTEGGLANTVRLTAKTAYHEDTHPDKASIIDASYIKLRQLSFGYTLPNSLTNKFKIHDVTVAFIGRNLGFLYKPSKHVDPEATYGAGNVQGLDIGTLPTTRSYGFSINFNF